MLLLKGCLLYHLDRHKRCEILCSISFCIQQTKRYVYGCKEIIQTEMIWASSDRMMDTSNENHVGRRIQECRFYYFSPREASKGISPFRRFPEKNPVFLPTPLPPSTPKAVSPPHNHESLHLLCPPPSRLMITTLLFHLSGLGYVGLIGMKY